MNNPSIFSLKIGGQAGQGIKAAGLTLAKVATRSGLNIHTYTEFPSLIRGGHNIMQIVISSEEISSPIQQTDLLIALNQDTLNKHLSELTPQSGLMFDKDKKFDTSKVPSEVHLYPVPFSQFAATAGGSELMSNTVAISAAAAILGADLETIQNLIREEFTAKGENIVNSNLQAVQLGYDYTKKEFPNQLQSLLTSKADSSKMIVNGTEAVALGAIAGGLQFSAIYPMSPISNLLQVFAKYQEKYGFVYKQPEDEISAVCMSIGASFAGARSLTATSGGGFCLMSEGLGLAAMTETPLVIIEGMRPGPATGLPTWSSQADLRFVLHAHQGEFPRIVLAAGDAKEAFELTRDALNLADIYQTPVIVLVDKNICDDDQSLPLFDLSSYQLSRGKLTLDFNPNYARYFVSEDGVSHRSIPGTGNFFVANSDEHQVIGFSTEEISDVLSQQDKRHAKFVTCKNSHMPSPQLFGPQDADLTIVSWGSNKGSILHALKELPNVNYLHLTWLSPFPDEAVGRILTGSKRVLDIESNSTAQLAGLIREQTGFTITDKLLKYDGRPIFPEEIVTKVKSLIHN